MKPYLIRGALCVLGVAIISIGISFLRFAELGTDPYSGMNIGLARAVGISFGTWQIIFNAILLVVVFFADRSKIGFGTLVSMVIVGYISDFGLFIIQSILPPENIYIRVTGMLLGILLICVGATIYIETNLGTSPYDALALVAAEKLHRESLFRWFRIFTDAVCVLVAWLFGSTVGIGTLLTALCTGPLISFFRTLLRRILPKQDVSP
ncbi:YczE/YyaS/YitT family protein [Breznakiella homolactica]|uniref:YitT family protein n=1 Tax=Breznakiella homolactica TaxID=2798577 RepID=A0A7T8BB04_9SPIR|nr:YitT family protein [Breznakiella homolactica]QQO09545.1 YitT family protein [Breznakiella homolactica]